MDPTAQQGMMSQGMPGGGQPPSQASQYNPQQMASQMSPFQIYEALRMLIMQLHIKGLPGADKLLHTLDQVHLSNISQATKGTTSPASQSQPQGQPGQPPQPGQ